MWHFKKIENLLRFSENARKLKQQSCQKNLQRFLKIPKTCYSVTRKAKNENAKFQPGFQAQWKFRNFLFSHSSYSEFSGAWCYSGISPTHGMLTFSLVFNFEEFFPNLLRPQLSDSGKLWKWKEICFAGLELFYIGQFINIFSAIYFNCKFRECIEINSRSNNMNIIN